MIEAPSVAGGRLHSTVRLSLRARKNFQFRTVRPSLLDLRFCGDAWIAEYADGKFAIYLGNYCVTTVEAGALDVPSLNSLFDMMRHRRPRRRNDK